MAHPLGKHVPQTADKPKETEPNNMFNKVILIGRLGQNAEAKTAQNNREYVILNIATQESWKNDKGDYENCVFSSSIAPAGSRSRRASAAPMPVLDRAPSRTTQ
jgi:Single-strand binding protein family